MASDSDGMKNPKRPGRTIDVAKLFSGNELSERDSEVLEHMARYRVGTIQSLRQTVFHGSSVNAVGKVTRRLVRKGWLTLHRLAPQVNVFTLSPKTCCLMELPADLAPKAISGDALVADVGILSFCCGDGRERTRLTREEVQESHTPFYSEDLDGGYFFLDSGSRSAKRGLVWVDPCGELEAFAAECRKQWEARWDRPPFREAVGRCGFRLVLLTGTEERALILRRLTSRMAWPAKVSLSVEVVPCLLPLYLRLEPFACVSRGVRDGARGGAPSKTAQPTARGRVKCPQLVRRDYDILRHLARYRVATLASLKATFFKGKSRSMVSLVCSRLVRNGWLRRHPLGFNGCYHALSAQSAFLLGDRSLAVDEPLHPREIAKELCLVRHCFEFRKKRVRLTKADLDAKYPFCAGTGPDHNAFCLDTGTTVERLEMVSLDHERTTEQTVNACHHVVRFLAKHDSFRKQTSRHGFQVFVYSGCKRRAEVLRRELARRSWGRGVCVTVEVLPELLRFANTRHEHAERHEPRFSSAAV